MFFVFLGDNKCSTVKCAHLCLYAKSATDYTCACMTGYKLIYKKYCNKLQTKYMFVSIHINGSKVMFTQFTNDLIGYTTNTTDVPNVIFGRNVPISAMVISGSDMYFFDNHNKWVSYQSRFFFRGLSTSFPERWRWR